MFKYTQKKGEGMTNCERGAQGRLERLHKEGDALPES